MHKIQIGWDIYNILEELYTIIHRDIKKQAHHIQVLLADKLDQCKERGVETVDEYVKML